MAPDWHTLEAKKRKGQAQKFNFIDGSVGTLMAVTWKVAGPGGVDTPPGGASVPPAGPRVPAQRSAASPPAPGAAPGCARPDPSRYQASPDLTSIGTGTYEAEFFWCKTACFKHAVLHQRIHLW